MRRFFSGLGYRMMNFMQGRYGTDKLNLAMLITAVVFDIVNMFLQPLWLRAIFGILSSALLVLAIYRTFSRNIPARQKELRAFNAFFNRLKTLRTHHIYRCPGCRQKIRVPRKHGVKVEIRCPKCGQTFTKKI